jgi:hypothetical protein
MKTIFLLLIFSFFLFNQVGKNKTVVSDMHTVLRPKGGIDFKTQIMPILQKRCSPCHFPGGKMYGKLPFDTASTILLKKEIILKRIKDDSENKLIRAFIEQDQN